MELTPSALLEALLFAVGGPIAKKELLALLEVTPPMLNTAIEALRVDLTSRGITLVEIGDELELRTSARASIFVDKLSEAERSKELGKAAMESLAIILYQGSATRSEIDWVRGVNSTAALRSLLIRGLVISAEDETDRRRARYTASADALAHLGISSLTELPGYTEIATSLSERKEVIAGDELISNKIPEA